MGRGSLQTSLKIGGLSKDLEDPRKLGEYIRGKPFLQRERPVQRPWGSSVPGRIGKEQGGQTGEGEGVRSGRGLGVRSGTEFFPE